MIINKEWRILTIGDGDLSFSSALFKHHPSLLTATVYDSLAALSSKYGDHFYQLLKAENCPVFCEFDICNTQSWPATIKKEFDLVIFQFPLLPAFNSFTDYKKHCSNISLNTLNRRLLRQFLVNSFTHFLDPGGQQLCFITSKDVKPYRQWNIEHALNLHTDIHYLGSIAFDINKFPGYKIRNVDRNKYVKDSRSTTYIWSRKKEHSIKKKLNIAREHADNYCTACRAGPFATRSDAFEHTRSKKHLKMMEFERLWLADIENSRHTKQKNNY